MTLELTPTYTTSLFRYISLTYLDTLTAALSLSLSLIHTHRHAYRHTQTNSFIGFIEKVVQQKIVKKWVKNLPLPLRCCCREKTKKLFYFFTEMILCLSLLLGLDSRKKWNCSAASWQQTDRNLPTNMNIESPISVNAQQ